uniref:Fatty acyl-CoA reductase n=1 Tax=Culicoides sonorensis TaxID=179676 RepID=A0A336LR38_CULSO
MSGDRITPSFDGKIIFLTGGTGFLGKVIIEKFLRCMPKLGGIWLLVRTKKGVDPQERLPVIFQNALFDSVKKEYGLDYMLKQVRAIPGDVSQLGLGLSDDDRKLITNNVNIIYHCAATIRFDEPLKRAVLLNTRGTKLMLDLAKECKKLEMFGYMGTAYCHLNEKLLLEKEYPPPTDPYKVISACEWLDDAAIDGITKKILGDIPNTYAFTKALSESLVMESMKEIPSVVWRPSIIIPCWKEPIPGWTDNINGPTGILIGAGKGVIRTMYCKQDGYGDFLPVDLAVNGVITSTWNFIANKDHSKRIWHMVSSAEIKLSWQEIVDLGRWIVKNKLPLNGVLWYPGGSMKSSRLQHNIACFLYHWVPAYVLDVLLICLGYDPVLKRVQRRIQNGFEVFEYYTNHVWDFDNANVLYLRAKLNEEESEKYKIDGHGVDIVDYFLNCVKAARLYILKETDDTIPDARRHMKIMWFVDKFYNSKK